MAQSANSDKKRARQTSHSHFVIVAGAAHAGAPELKVRELGKFTHFPEILRSSLGDHSVIVR